MSDSTPTPDSPLFTGFWSLVADEGWQRLSLHRLAEEAGLSLAALREQVPYKAALPLRFAQAVDASVLRDSPASPGGSARDRVFDVLMRRIDVLQPHRAGIVRLSRDLRTDPLLALMLAPQLAASMAWMLEAARVEAGGLAGALRVQGLCGVWLATLRAWEQDEGADLGATMAGLDRALDKAESLARTLRLDAGGDTSGDASGDTGGDARPDAAGTGDTP